MSMPPEDAATRRIKLGWEEFLELPEDANRYEILDGELVMTPPPAIRHQVVLSNLNDCLRSHVSANGLGIVLFAPVAVPLDETTIRVKPRSNPLSFRGYASSWQSSGRRLTTISSA